MLLWTLSLLSVVHTKLPPVPLSLRGRSDPFPFHSSSGAELRALHVVPSVLGASAASPLSPGDVHVFKGVLEASQI